MLNLRQSKIEELDPPTMGLRSGWPAIETEQALMDSEAVANSFNASLASSSIFLVVYCSASLTLQLLQR
ncbi:hypothetical protein ZIOFF_044421 [Zingiber officinale]|uniref:Uncharacterized protein n=1 Tax=Zingiber officinale TaxID=94328 RepID=A0A8J5KUF8_ZINOF|nr:hypothetical protein ZIOFF_044421 [Zingiber officinale]